MVPPLPARAARFASTPGTPPERARRRRPSPSAIWPRTGTSERPHAAYLAEQAKEVLLPEWSVGVVPLGWPMRRADRGQARRGELLDGVGGFASAAATASFLSFAVATIRYASRTSAAT